MADKSLIRTRKNRGDLPDSLTETTQGAKETQRFRTEVANSVTSSGQTLTPDDGTNADLYQTSKASFLYGTAGSSFQDNSAVPNIYQLTLMRGDVSLRYPNNYDLLHGCIINFKPANTNTGASTLALWNQEASTYMDAKAIKTIDGNDVGGGVISSSSIHSFLYDSTADAWILMSIIFPVTSKGGIITRNDSGVVELPVGSNGQVLSADDTEDSGLKWVSMGGGVGSVAQMFAIQPSFQQSISPFGAKTISTLGITITPKKAGNRIVLELLLKASFTYVSGESSSTAEISIYRNGIKISATSRDISSWRTSIPVLAGSKSFEVQYIDESSLGTETVYALYVDNTNGSSTFIINKGVYIYSFFKIMEIET